ncbi:MAG: glycoside hydrolase family 5 protein [Limisphaerales bacterium]
MMKNLSVSMAALAFMVLSAGAQPAGFLHAKDKRIVDGQGRELTLRGMGLGGWMLQEGYMLGISKEGTQHSIKSRIAGLVGKEDCARFYQLWLQNDFTRADVDLLAKLGFNSIRLPMHYNLFTLPIEEEPVQGQDTWLTTGFALVDDLLSWCKANQMYLILDLHAAPGGQGKDANISDSDPAKPSLWESPLNRQKTVALWRKLAERYANETSIGGYDLLNEPNWTFEGKNKNGTQDSSNKPLWDLYQSITKAIREVDTNHMLIIEGNGWGNNYNGFPGPWETDLVFSFHKYWNPNTQEAIARFIALRDRYHQPLWLGESGENSNQWFRDCVALVERNHIGWAWWPYKKVGSESCILTVKRPDEFRKCVDYWNKGGEPPSREIAAKGLFDLVENLKAANCRCNTNVARALIPPAPPTSAPAP